MPNQLLHSILLLKELKPSTQANSYIVQDEISLANIFLSEFSSCLKIMGSGARLAEF